MRQRTVFVLAIFSVILFVGSPYSSAQALKIGYLDFDEVSAKWDEFKKESDFLENQMQALLKEAKDEELKLKDEFDQFKLKQDLLSADTVVQRKKELTLQLQDMRQKRQVMAQNFQETKDSKLKPLYDKLRDAVDEVATKEKYSFVFAKRQLLFVDPKFNIADKVLAVLKKK